MRAATRPECHLDIGPTTGSDPRQMPAQRPETGRGRKSPGRPYGAGRAPIGDMCPSAVDARGVATALGPHRLLLVAIGVEVVAPRRLDARAREGRHGAGSYRGRSAA